MKRVILFTTIICVGFFISLNSFTTHRNSNLVQEVLNQTNRFRRSKGLNQLTIRKDLNSIAQQHSADMAHGRVAFGHSGFGRRNDEARKKIRSLESFAENVAYGPTSGKEVVMMWENSPGHRRNLLGHFKYIGIGIAKDNHGRIFYTQVFAG